MKKCTCIKKCKYQQFTHKRYFEVDEICEYEMLYSNNNFYLVSGRSPIAELFHKRKFQKFFTTPTLIRKKKLEKLNHTHIIYTSLYKTKLLLTSLLRLNIHLF